MFLSAIRKYSLINPNSFPIFQVHYISKTEEGVLSSPDVSTKDLFPAPTRKGGAKKATLSAWMTLQSIPEETIITPTILEFLEQVRVKLVPSQSESS